MISIAYDLLKKENEKLKDQLKILNEQSLKLTLSNGYFAPLEPGSISVFHQPEEMVRLKARVTELETKFQDYSGEVEELQHERKKLEADKAMAIGALKACASRTECRSYSCCGSCGPIYEAEEALEKLEAEK